MVDHDGPKRQGAQNLPPRQRKERRMLLRRGRSCICVNAEPYEVPLCGTDSRVSRRRVADNADPSDAKRAAEYRIRPEYPRPRSARSRSNQRGRKRRYHFACVLSRINAVVDPRALAHRRPARDELVQRWVQERLRDPQRHHERVQHPRVP